MKQTTMKVISTLKVQGDINGWKWYKNSWTIITLINSKEAYRPKRVMSKACQYFMSQPVTLFIADPLMLYWIEIET